MKLFRWLLYFTTFSLPGIIPCPVLANEVLDFINFTPTTAELNDDFPLEKTIRLEPFIVENIADLRAVESNQEPWQTSVDYSHSLTSSTVTTEDLRGQSTQLVQLTSQALTEPTKKGEQDFLPAITPEKVPIRRVLPNSRPTQKIVNSLAPTQ
ncbi:hypothetical protein NON20_23320 [Synechocystis sp. B12]|nr:hypothetical protein NON20_23320 [Synechocystis sp. B12]